MARSVQSWMTGLALVACVLPGCTLLPCFPADGRGKDIGQDHGGTDFAKSSCPPPIPTVTPG